jgi:hypothetical protein
VLAPGAGLAKAFNDGAKTPPGNQIKNNKQHTPKHNLA